MSKNTPTHIPNIKDSRNNYFYYPWPKMLWSIILFGILEKPYYRIPAHLLGNSFKIFLLKRKKNRHLLCRNYTTVDIRYFNIPIRS